MYDSIYPTGRCYVNFPDKGVEIFIPPQGKPIKVIAEMFLLDEISFEKGEFTPHRPVIKFEVQDKSDQSEVQDKSDQSEVQDNSDQVEIAYSPPIELKVFFTYLDVDKVGGDPKNLNIAFYPEDKQRWILFEEEKHKLRRHILEYSDNQLEDNSWVGYFVVEISHWGDPSVSVGR